MTENLRHGHPPAHPEGAEYERQDLSSKLVFYFLGGLALIILCVHLFLTGVFHVVEHYYRAHQPPQNPLVTDTSSDTRVVPPSEITKFPEPRLEQNERLEIKDFRLTEEKTLNSYGWVDEQSGVAHIPIERAMEIIAQRGLPTTPRAGTAPESAVSVARQGAERSDTSNVSGKSSKSSANKTGTNKTGTSKKKKE